MSVLNQALDALLDIELSKRTYLQNQAIQAIRAEKKNSAWVDLTDVEVTKIYKTNLKRIGMIKATQELLKEKNT